MGTILDAPVQILMGTNVRGAFTAEDNRDILDKLLGTAAPKTGARLPEVIEKRRSDMASQGMILPLVGYADDERLAPNQFLVTVALQTGYKKRYTFRYGCGYDKSCSDSGSE